ncbi:hypothetical protein HK102_004929, partial [Quaeritorhiza haematococci]
MDRLDTLATPPNDRPESYQEDKLISMYRTDPEDVVVPPNSTQVPPQQPLPPVPANNNTLDPTQQHLLSPSNPPYPIKDDDDPLTRRNTTFSIVSAYSTDTTAGATIFTGNGNTDSDTTPLTGGEPSSTAAKRLAMGRSVSVASFVKSLLVGNGNGNGDSKDDAGGGKPTKKSLYGDGEWNPRPGRVRLAIVQSVFMLISVVLAIAATAMPNWFKYHGVIEN